MKFSSTLVALVVAVSSALATSTTSPVKRGVSYNDPNAADLFGTKISWQYNWGSTPSGAVNAGREFVPMLWSADAGHTQNWLADASAAIASGSTHLLGFNEPDLSSQSNLTPQEAVDAWTTWMEPFAGQAKLCSPAITNGGPPMGTAWMDTFLDLCDTCTIDCIAIHIYDSASNTAYFENYIADIGTRYNKPVWVTEFGASGTSEEQTTFLDTMLPYLDGLSSVERYAYFMAGDDILVDSSNQLTSLGETYNTL